MTTRQNPVAWEVLEPIDPLGFAHAAHRGGTIRVLALGTDSNKANAQSDADIRFIVRACNSFEDLLAAAELAVKAIRHEWLYQTGQFSRAESPPSDYPPQGSIYGGLHDVLLPLNAAIAKAKEERP